VSGFTSDFLRKSSTAIIAGEDGEGQMALTPKNSLAFHVTAHVHLNIKIAMMVRSIFSFLFLGIYAYCQTGTAPVAAPAKAYDYSGEAEVIRQMDTVYDYNADGTGDKTQTISVLVQSDAAVRQIRRLARSHQRPDEAGS
jgi:hypothetical protein